MPLTLTVRNVLLMGVNLRVDVLAHIHFFVRFLIHKFYFFCLTILLIYPGKRNFVTLYFVPRINQFT